MVDDATEEESVSKLSVRGTPRPGMLTWAAAGAAARSAARASGASVGAGSLKGILVIGGGREVREPASSATAPCLSSASGRTRSFPLGAPLRYNSLS